MSAFLWTGTFLGALLGIYHASLMYRQRLADNGGRAASALYDSAWAFALWTLFGAYVLFFYLLGVIAKAAMRLFKKGAPS